eukprot:scaffold20031_cov28-Prasinocladus_malaysianus.AAC.1
MNKIRPDSTAWVHAAGMLFDSLNETQRKLIVKLSENPKRLGTTLVEKAKKMEEPARGLGGSEAVQDALEAGTESGAAFVAFGKRAVKLRYLSQEQLDAVVVRLVGVEDPEERELETVKAMRRFLSTPQPMGVNIRVQPNCKTFTKKLKNGKEETYDLNGMELNIDGFAPPGGDPERYNVVCEEDEDGCQAVLEIEPKYLRPCPPEECDGPDEYADEIPEDHKADEWWAGVLAHHKKCELISRFSGQKFGPSRPSGPSECY